MPIDLTPVWLSLKLATITTIILLLIGVPLAWWLSQRRNLLSNAISAVVTLPLVLPPSVLGFYILIALGPQGPLGQITQHLGLGFFTFSFVGLVFGSVIYSLPFMIQPLQTAYERISNRPMEVALTLGVSPIKAFFTAVLPLAKNGLMTAIVMTFAHTMGEFGVVLMIGGNIPGKTQVISTEIFTFVEAMEFEKAHILAGGMVFFSFLILMVLMILNRQSEKAHS